MDANNNIVPEKSDIVRKLGLLLIHVFHKCLTVEVRKRILHEIILPDEFRTLLLKEFDFPWTFKYYVCTNQETWMYHHPTFSIINSHVKQYIWQFRKQIQNNANNNTFIQRFQELSHVRLELFQELNQLFDEIFTLFLEDRGKYEVSSSDREIMNCLWKIQIPGTKEFNERKNAYLEKIIENCDDDGMQCNQNLLLGANDNLDAIEKSKTDFEKGVDLRIHNIRDALLMNERGTFQDIVDELPKYFQKMDCIFETYDDFLLRNEPHSSQLSSSTPLPQKNYVNQTNITKIEIINDNTSPQGDSEIVQFIFDPSTENQYEHTHSEIVKVYVIYKKWVPATPTKFDFPENRNKSEKNTNFLEEKSFIVPIKIWYVKKFHSQQTTEIVHPSLFYSGKLAQWCGKASPQQQNKILLFLFKHTQPDSVSRIMMNLLHLHEDAFLFPGVKEKSKIIPDSCPRAFTYELANAFFPKYTHQTAFMHEPNALCQNVFHNELAFFQGNLKSGIQLSMHADVMWGDLAKRMPYISHVQKTSLFVSEWVDGPNLQSWLLASLNVILAKVKQFHKNEKENSENINNILIQKMFQDFVNHELLVFLRQVTYCLINIQSYFPFWRHNDLRCTNILLKYTIPELRKANVSFNALDDSFSGYAKEPIYRKGKLKKPRQQQKQKNIEIAVEVNDNNYFSVDFGSHDKHVTLIDFQSSTGHLVYRENPNSNICHSVVDFSYPEIIVRNVQDMIVDLNHKKAKNSEKNLFDLFSLDSTSEEMWNEEYLPILKERKIPTSQEEFMKLLIYIGPSFHTIMKNPLKHVSMDACHDIKTLLQDIIQTIKYFEHSVVRKEKETTNDINVFLVCIALLKDKIHELLDPETKLYHGYWKNNLGNPGSLTQFLYHFRNFSINF